MEERQQRTGDFEENTIKNIIEYKDNKIIKINKTYTTMKRITTLFLLIIITLQAQAAYDYSQYKDYVAEVKKEVWGKDLPQFDNLNVPAKYKNESAIIMACYEELNVDYIDNLNFLYKVANIRGGKGTHIKRYLVKINDKAALEKFSTFDYRSYSREVNYGMGYNDYLTVIGVKVIKPDGTIKEVSYDEYQDAHEGKKGDEKRIKLAVPNLQIGDMIDYFVYDYEDVKEENIAPVTFFFGSNYPLLDYQIHCAIDSKICTQYRTMNGAPDFTCSKDKDKEILDLHVKDIDKTLYDYAFNPIKQTPHISLYMTGKYAAYYTPKSAESKGVFANPSAEIIQNDAWCLWSEWVKVKMVLDNNLLTLIRNARKLTTDEEKADYIYEYFVMHSLLNNEAYIAPIRFSNYFTYILRCLKVPFNYALTTNSFNEPIDELINYSNATRIVVLKNGKCYFPLGYAVSANVVPSIYQNRDAVRTEVLKKLEKGPFTQFKIACSSASDNVERVEVKATIEDEKINIERQNTHIGCAKEKIIPYFTTAEEISKSWGKAYGYNNYTEALSEDYKKSKAKAKAEERAENDKEKISENFKSEIKNYHEKAPISINQTKVTSFGDNNTPFTYLLNYQMDGLVKKAGRNLVVSVGQLFGSHSHIEGNERKRDEDVIFNYPRTYEVTLNLEIPSGYSIPAESMKKLNKYIDNDAISFTTVSEVKDNKLVISFRKIYKQQHVPVSDWNKVLEVLDGAYEFTSQQIILKKN